MTLDEKALQYLNQLSRHNNVICCLVYDTLEETLPTPGIYSITDGSKKGSLNTIIIGPELGIETFSLNVWKTFRRVR